MRHKYETRGIVFSRSPLGEANASIMLLTEDLGLVRVRAQGLRKSGAKLATALTTLAESNVILVRGKENWKIVGAVLIENWFSRLNKIGSRTRAARVFCLLVRLVAEEARDPRLFHIMKGYFNALATLPEEMHENAEILAAIRTLAVLGLDKEDVSDHEDDFSRQLLKVISAKRASYILRINNGINSSGL